MLAPLVAPPLYIVAERPPAKRVALIAAAVAALVGLAAVYLSMRFGRILGSAFDEYSRVYLTQLAKLNPDAEKNAYSLSVLNEAYLFFQYGVRWFLPYEGWMSINMRPPFPVSWASFPQVLG